MSLQLSESPLESSVCHATDRDTAQRSAKVQPVKPGLWDAIAGHPHASLFSSPLWSEGLARSYGFEVRASTLGGNGSPQAALLFAEINDVRGHRVVSIPFADFCDPLVSDPEDWQRLVAPLMGLGIPVTLRCLRNTLPATDQRFVLTSRAAWHGVDLTRPETTLWEGLRASVRGNVRKAQRLGVSVREGRRLEDVRTFYEMHCHVRKRKYRLLPQPFAFFEHLHELFSAQSRLTVLIAELDGRPIAGNILIEWGGILYYKFSASLEAAASPNDLLIWEGVKLGQQRGLSLFDFGASDLDQPSLIFFKRKFATEEQTILRLKWEPEGYVSEPERHANRVLSRVTDLFTDASVPDAITRAAGDQLYAVFC